MYSYIDGENVTVFLFQSIVAFALPTKNHYNSEPSKHTAQLQYLIWFLSIFNPSCWMNINNAQAFELRAMFYCCPTCFFFFLSFCILANGTDDQSIAHFAIRRLAHIEVPQYGILSHNQVCIRATQDFSTSKNFFLHFSAERNFLLFCPVRLNKLFFLAAINVIQLRFQLFWLMFFFFWNSINHSIFFSEYKRFNC